MPVSRPDLPILPRCCFCMPPRCGLLAWGYFKLVTAPLVLGYLLWILLKITYIFSFVVDFEFMELTPGILSLVFVTVDVILNIILVVGCHKKNVKLLKVYYSGNLTVLVLTTLIGAVCMIIAITSKSKLEKIDQIVTVHLGRDLYPIFINLLVQAYILIFVKNDIVTRQDTSSFKSENTEDAEKCTVKVESLTKDKEAAI